VKPCEPPAGVAHLAGALASCNISCTVMDANIEALLWLMHKDVPARDNWTKRALAHRDDFLGDIRDKPVYSNVSQYRQRVMDLGRLLGASLSDRFRISFSDYMDHDLSPHRSRDLIRAAEDFKSNPFYDFFEERLSRRLEKSRASHVGISLCFLSQALTTFALIGWLRCRYPSLKIILGGGLVTSWMSSPGWKDPFKGLVDLMVKGAGEKPLLELCGASRNNGGEFLPDFDFAAWDRYLAPGRILPFRSSSGCYWNRCRFCPEKAEGHKFIPGDPEILLKELGTLVNTHHPDHVHFLDNAIPPAFLKALAAGTHSFTWYGFVRFSRLLTDESFCRALFRSGCRMLKLGLESGDQDVLDKMNKGCDLATASRALSAIKAAGIKTYVYLLFGTSFETRAAAERTMAFTADLHDKIDFLNLAVFNLPRYSEDAARLETSDFNVGDLSLYLQFKHPAGWDRKEVRRFLDKKFKKHPAIAPIIRRDPPYFTSNHAMFINGKRLQGAADARRRACRRTHVL